MPHPARPSRAVAAMLALAVSGSCVTASSARAGGVTATSASEPFPSDLPGDLLVFDLWRMDLFRARPDGSDVRELPVDLGGSDAAGVATGTRAAYGTMGGLAATGYVAGATAGGWFGGAALGTMMAASGVVLAAPALGITKAVQIAKRHHRVIRSIVQVQNAVALSPAGDRLLFCSDTARSVGTSNLRLIDVSGPRGNRTRVRARLQFGGLCPSFSADGQWALFIAPRSRKDVAEIWSFNASERDGPRQLTSDGAPKTFPHFSPDGTLVAWQGLVLEGDDAGTWQVFVMPAGGGAPRQLTHDPLAAVTPSWAADGSGLVYASLEDGGLWLAPLDGGAPTALVTGGAMKLHPQASRDARHVMYLESSVAPANLQPPEDGETRGKKDKPLVGGDFQLRLTRLADGATWPVDLEKPGRDGIMEKTNLFWFQWRRPAAGG